MPERKTYFLVLFSVILLLSIVVVQFRLTDAISEMTSMKPFADLSGCYGKMVTRNGDDLFDKQACMIPPLENLVGSTKKGGTLITNSLSNYYEQKLFPKDVDAVSGYHKLKGVEGRVLTTTLLGGTAQKLLAATLENHRGSIFAYNYVTGEIYTSISLPSSLTSNEEGSMVNVPMSGLYIPGSTMKIMTLAVALSQQPELKKHKYTCKGQFQLPDGNTIQCNNTYGHGELDMIAATGESCNCYFASLITNLEVAKAIESLQSFGMNVNGDGGTARKIDELKSRVGSTNFNNTESFQHVWALIGQGDTVVSPVNMAMFAGAIANGGQCAQPYIVQSIQDPNHNDYFPYKAKEQSISMVNKKTAKTVKDIWEKAVEEHYTGYDDSITMVKTGTPELGNGANKTKNKLLIGAIPSKNTAFYIATENTNTIEYARNAANLLAELLPNVTK